MIPDPLAMGVIVSAAAVGAAHLSVRAYLIVLSLFALVWVFASNGIGSGTDGWFALVVLMFLIAAGLVVAATLHMGRMFFPQARLSRMHITLWALVGSAVATVFLFFLFSR